MLSLRKPSTHTIQKFLASQSELPYSYPQVGATRVGPPQGYAADHTRVRIGAGERTFESAKAALGRWDQFRLGWVDAWSPESELHAGGVVGVAGRSMGLWWLNACRIIYMIDEQHEGVTKFGFAYGTLPGHIEMGEERFLIEWNHADDSVWFDILAYSRPRHILARLGKTWVRRLQKRFGRDSAAAMVRAGGR